MSEKHIICINKPHHQSAHEHITHIGNLTEKWRITRETAIYQIEANINQFYTIERATGKKCYIGVVKEAGKPPFLRSHADGKWNDNLLAQSECDSSCRLE